MTAVLPVVLPDGTPSYAPIGTVVRDGQKVMCHLCGRWFRSVLAHLRTHGWDGLTYRAAFGLERTEPLEGDPTRSRRARAMRERRAHDPAIRAGCVLGQEMARSGALTRAAAEAARGRRHPEQRRRKTLRALAAISPEARAAGARRRASEHLREVGAAAAAGLGFPDLGALVRARVATGASLASISREAGLHKDWLSRHLATVDPAVAEEVTDHRSRRHRSADARWLPTVRRLGFDTVPAYLADRHVAQRRTIGAMARELGLPRAAVESALARHDIAHVPHATSRARREERRAELAERFGHPTFAAYVTDRRAAGLSWRAIAAECGQPEIWVRRQAGAAR